jgi:tetrahydromethanopterin S-methyltransferase subunit H
VASLYNDFLLYGPIESAPWIFPAIATSNSILATFAFDEAKALPTEADHPLNQFFTDFAAELRKASF